jgi:hypothetical protein
VVNIAVLSDIPNDPLWARWPKAWGREGQGESDLMQKSDTAWKTAALMAALAEETDDDYEREHFTRLRAAWITVATRCETFHFPDVTEK